MTSGGPAYPGSPFQAVRFLPFRNDSGETVPAFGVLNITGAAEQEGQIVLTASKFVTTNPIPNHMLLAVNGPSQVTSASPYGKCTVDPPFWVSYDYTDGTPAAGEAWGVYSGFAIRKDITGAGRQFMILGQPQGSGSSTRALCWWNQQRPFGGFGAASGVGTITTSGGPIDFSASATGFDAHGVLPYYDTVDKLYTKQAGAYFVCATGYVTRLSGTSAQDVAFNVTRNGTGVSGGPSNTGTIPASSSSKIPICVSGTVYSDKGDYWSLYGITTADTCLYTGQFYMFRVG